jgi:replicative DNA helicase
MIFPAHTFSDDAEQNLLSILIIDATATVSRCIAAGIGKNVFHNAAHGIVFECLAELVARSVPVDASSLAEALRARGQLEDVGGFPAIVAITNSQPTAAQATFYIGRVAALAKQRRLIRATAEAHEQAVKPAAEWSDAWANVEPYLRAAQYAGGTVRRRSLAESAAQAAQYRLEPDTRPTTPTPWPAWDRYATPPRAGELIVIAGRPGTGKTTLAGNIAHDCAASGGNVAFFSLEMGAEELIDRFALRRAGRAGLGGDKTANGIVAAQIGNIGKMKSLHIYEAEDAGSVAQIEATCRLLAASPAGLAAVVIDYLQLVTPPADSKRDGREQQVAAMSRRLKLMARAVDCPVFLVAQLNRESEKDDRRPRLSDLRESGAIEQDADRVWLLFVPKPAPGAPLPDEDASTVQITITQAKCRNGPAGVSGILNFNKPTFDFSA